MPTFKPFTVHHVIAFILPWRHLDLLSVKHTFKTQVQRLKNGHMTFCYASFKLVVEGVL